jgi:hypothetical protein
MDDFLTAEPAVVVPKDDDEMMNGSSISMEATAAILNLADPEFVSTTTPRSSAQYQQHGALFRRSGTVISALKGVHRARMNSLSDMMQREGIPLIDHEADHPKHPPVTMGPYASTKTE